MHPYKPGDRIAQLIIQPCLVPVSSTTLYTKKDDILCPVCMEQVMFVETEYLSTTTRGSGAYGSTGR